MLLFLAADYYVSDVATSFESVTCTLASPELDYTVDRITLKDDLGLNDSVGPVWIGYYSAYQSFQYYGNALNKKLPSVIHLVWSSKHFKRHISIF